MRFLVITKTKHPLPPQMAVGLLDAMIAWTDTYTKSGKMEQIWSFAGYQAGGGILNVESLEELDSVMVHMPLAPFSHVEVYGLVDVKDALNRGKQVTSEMMQGAGPR
jgi:muconolactone delta-isomerase